MTDQLDIMRLARTGRGYWASLKLGEQWFNAHSWDSFEDAEAKIRSDVQRATDNK